MRESRSTSKPVVKIDNSPSDSERRIHGSRADFIQNTAERLLSKVNEEASDLTQAQHLFSQYMLEFCDEYDRCGYYSAPAETQQAD